MFPQHPGQPPDDDPLLTVKEAAARAGMAASSWRAGVFRGYLPAPDFPDTDTPGPRRRPLWRRSTVDGRRRIGQGKRKDLIAARKDRQQRLAAELTEPTPPPAVDVRAWLAENHRPLLDMAEVLVDYRDQLVAGCTGTLAAELEQAIDRAGEEISSRPSRMLASAVTYAQFLLQNADVPGPVREVLVAHADLHRQFNRLRPRIDLDAR